MNFRYGKKILLTFGLLWMTACQDAETTSQLDWGHLNGSSLVPDAPQYLINQKPGQPYRVCVPQYMLDELPGLRAEITAAINIWGRYIGREIPVQIVAQPLPRASTSLTPNTLRSQYYQSCGNNFHTVLGVSPLPGTTVGQTGSSWRTNAAGQVMSFQRHVVLRDYRLSPDPYGRTKSWISMQELTKRSYTADQLIDIMEQRGRIEVDPSGRRLTLSVLVHEFGHVWGLCDQYEGPSNCDPRHSSKHPELNSIMAAASSVNKIYLTDDDITGIRELAKRPGFSKHWPGTTYALSVPPKPISSQEIQYFQLKGVEKQGNVHLVNFGLVTRSQGGELRVQYRTGTSAIWQNAPTYFPSQKAFKIADHTLRVTLPQSSSPYQFRLVFKAKLSNNTLATPVYRYL